MKKPIVLAGLMLIASGASVVAQETNQALSSSPGSHVAQSASKDQKAKTGPAKTQPNPDKKQPEGLTLSKEQIIKVQKALHRYDYYDGPIDGKMSSDLRQAIKDFQEDEGLEPTGEIDEETYKRVLALQDEESGEEPPSKELAFR